MGGTPLACRLASGGRPRDLDGAVRASDSPATGSGYRPGRPGYRLCGHWLAAPVTGLPVPGLAAPVTGSRVPGLAAPVTGSRVPGLAAPVTGSAAGFGWFGDGFGN
ncbi:hypothetical protein [Streptomyces iakyrus]|uniref:hypothetical protein n=1 Tax=Streptomyces iakyrus TaxID=68219 RepID=UPI0036B041AF